MSSKRWWFMVDKSMPSEACSHEGKPEWRDGITLQLTRRRALAIIEGLASHLRWSNEAEDEPIDLHLLGELERYEE